VITYLDNGYAYIGSHFGDSQLIRLQSERVSNGEFLQVIDSFTNLAPITDFCVIDLEKQGQVWR